MGTVRSIRSKKSFMEVLAVFGIHEMPEKRNLYCFNGTFWSEPRNWKEFLEEITRAKASLIIVEKLQEKIKEDELATKELEKLKDRLNYHMTEYYDVMWDLYYCYMNDRDVADFLISDKEDRQNYTFRGKCYY